LSLSDFAGDERAVWPENWPAYDLFRWMDTQWLWTMGQRCGLNYQTLYMRMDRIGLDVHEREALEMDIRVMEGAALEQIAEDTEAAEASR
jgi:hypothetical protein